MARAPADDERDEAGGALARVALGVDGQRAAADHVEQERRHRARRIAGARAAARRSRASRGRTSPGALARAEVLAVEEHQVHAHRRRRGVHALGHLEQHGDARAAVVGARHRDAVVRRVGVLVAPRARVVVRAQHDAPPARAARSAPMTFVERRAAGRASMSVNACALDPAAEPRQLGGDPLAHRDVAGVPTTRGPAWRPGGARAPACARRPRRARGARARAAARARASAGARAGAGARAPSERELRAQLDADAAADDVLQAVVLALAEAEHRAAGDGLLKPYCPCR